MAWGSCYTPDWRVMSVVGAAIGTTALNDRRLFEAITGAPSFIIDSLDTGRYAMRCDVGAATAFVNMSLVAASSRYSGVLCRFKLNGLTTNLPFIKMLASTVGENIIVRVNASTGVIAYSFNNAGAYTNSGTSVSAGTVYRLEVFVDWNTGTTHTLKIKLNGVEIVNTTGGTAIVTGGDPSIGPTVISASMIIDIADIVTYNDVAQYGVLSDWRVHALEPISDGAHSMTANDFQSAASANLTNATTTSWDWVNDAPTAAPSTTDHVKQVVLRTTSYMEWNLRAMPGGYDNPVLVSLAAALHPVGAATANTCGFHLVSGAHESTEAVIDTSVAADTLEYRRHFYPTEPGGASWTVAMAQALKARFGYSSDATPNPACDAIMAFVVSNVVAAATAIAPPVGAMIV